MLGIDIDEDAELKGMGESVEKILEFTESDGELSQVSKHTPQVDAFYKKLFSAGEAVERLKEFSVAMSRAGELVTFLREH